MKKRFKLINFRKNVIRNRQKWVDLGLPSGTLWADTNEEGKYNWYEAVSKFQTQIPKRWQFYELVEECIWKWDVTKNGYEVIGPNGNKIFLPAAGYYDRYDNIWRGSGFYGYYWSATSLSSASAYGMIFGSGGVSTNYGDKSDSYSCVRLVKPNVKETKNE